MQRLSNYVRKDNTSKCCHVRNKNYDNPQCEGEKEFEDDLKRFKYIKRLLRRYYDTGVLKERLLLNHLIVLNNVFSMEAATTLLLYKIQPTYWPALKSFLIYLNSISDNELIEIEHDMIVLETLGKI